MVYKDQLNREVKLTKTPERIVSLVPSQTELLVDLGLEEKIMGITKFCVHPENLRKKKKVVGGTKSVHYDKIKALKPDFIICNKEENTEEMVVELEKIAPTWVSDIVSIDDAFKMISKLGEVLKVSDKASKIISEIEKEMQIFSEAISEKPIKKVGYLIWKKPLMAVGDNTFVNTLLNLNKFKNIFSKKISRYPEVTAEELKDAELILLSSEPFPFKEKHCEHFESETGRKCVLVDGEYFSWYGSRLKKAFRYFETLHM